MTRLICLVALASLAAGCGSDPVSYSNPVGINLKQKSEDVQSGAITTEKNITTESGNPYGAFVTAARNALGGKDPSRIEVESVTLLLGATSTGVTALEQVFTGKVDVLFVMNDTNNSYPVAYFTDPKGQGPVDATVTFDGASVFGGVDRDKLLTGSFSVVLRGTAASTFTGKTGDADLQTTLTFKAFE